MTSSLRRSLGLLDATALVVGCVIGAGIFRTATSIAKHLHTPALVITVWVLGGVVSFCGIAAALLVWIGTFDQIVTYSTVAISIFFAMAAFAVIILRRKDPERPRPYRVWGYPWTPLIFVLAMGLFIVNIAWMQPKETLIGFLLTGLGFPLYIWSRALIHKGEGVE